MSSPRVTFSFFRYPAWYSPLAFVVMGFQGLFRDADLPPGEVRLMGCGGGDGFSILPDLRAYCLMSALDDPDDLARLRRSRFYRRIAGPSHEQVHFTLEPVSGHGTWGGASPFAYSGRPRPGQPFAVLTHARVTARRAPSFWRSVPAIRADLRSAPGCVYQIGFGEHPLRTLATFSIWDDLARMQAFAYRGTPHQATSRAARQQQWLSESIFVRFAILGIEGDLAAYPGLAALAGRLKPTPADPAAAPTPDTCLP